MVRVTVKLQVAEE